MTAAISKKSKSSFFGIRFRSKLVENKKIFIVNCILELIGLPIIAVLMIYDEYLNKIKDYSNAFDFDGIFVVSVIAVVLSLASGALIAVASFRYLSKKSITDMNYSLPLTSRQRFFADYLSGLFIYAVPAAAAALLSTIILGIGEIFVDIELWTYFGKLLLSGFIVFLGMILFYSLNVLAVTCCGSLFEAIFSIVAINSVIPAFIACIYECIISTVNYGMDFESILYNNIFTVTSPFGNAIFFGNFMDNVMYAEANSSLTAFMYTRWLIPELIFLAAVVGLSYFLYQRRKAESVSKPYVYKTFYFAIIAASVFCTVALCISESNYDVSAIITGIFICAIFCFILEVITNRGFRRFWISVIRFAAAIAAAFVFCTVCEHSDGLSAGKYVPRAAAVESVSINEIGNTYLNDIRFNDKDVINAAVNLHKDLVNRHYNFDDYEYNTTKTVPENKNVYYDNENFSVTYYLKNGSTVIRNYNCYSQLKGELAKAVLLSDEYAEFNSSHMAIDCINDANYHYYYSGNDFSEVGKNREGMLSLSNRILLQEGSVKLSYDEINELREAYKKDWLNADENDLYSKLYGCMNSNYPIFEGFENTISFIESHGLKAEEVNESYIKESTNRNASIIADTMYLSDILYYFKDGDYRYSSYYDYYDIPHITPDVIADGITSISFKTYRYSSSENLNSYFLDDEYVEAAMTLIDNSTPYMFGEMPLATIRFNENRALFVHDTEETREALEKIKPGSKKTDSETLEKFFDTGIVQE